jgi:hypothetical protein
MHFSPTAELAADHRVEGADEDFPSLAFRKQFDLSIRVDLKAGG